MNADTLELTPTKNRQFQTSGTESGFVEIAGESFYRILDSDRMDPFLMNLVSGSNHWMFIASNGALTAGRRNADNALFPYYTQDKLFDLAHTVGPVSMFWIDGPALDHSILWRPFSTEPNVRDTQRNLYKNIDGSKLIFEAIHEVTGLRFRYSWMTGDEFGFVRQSELLNGGSSLVDVRLLDGIQNMVPYGLDQAFVNQFSNLSDAYKKNEQLDPAGLGVYYLSSIPTDRAEPSEGLKATVAWSTGLEDRRVLVSSRQVSHFVRGESIASESETRGLRCAYLVESKLSLDANESSDWWLAADINQDATQVERLRSRLESAEDLVNALQEDVDRNEESLRGKIGDSDGFQKTAEPLRDARHRSNTLFNIMRGGIFDEGYRVRVADFKDYVRDWNRGVSERYNSEIDALGESVSKDDLVEWAEEVGDSHLQRLAMEYLPLSFSRRHGDPSRPWNKFSIETQDDEGNPILGYQGNWRDIFQNWEPLAYSYPGYLTGMILRFLNSSTADGYNPYRVTRDGFDWEILDPDEPWSNIGYWGDHQIIYLLKLLEALKAHNPRVLDDLLEKDCFVYAHVPYRIRGFSKVWENPRETIDFDEEAARSIANRTRKLGADDKLLVNRSGRIVSANMWEKLFSPLLAKMSNFVVDGGIWMNTQRPEWNDANNALVGYGVSVVTLCYVNRYLEFLNEILSEGLSSDAVSMDAEIAKFLENQLGVLKDYESRIDSSIDNELRFAMLKELGESGEVYRLSVYEEGFGEEKIEVPVALLKIYIEKALLFVGRSIDSNRREDGMYHSYNLLSPAGENSVQIERLSEMLEGQVAALSSRRLSSEEALELLASLKSSQLYREDVDSYLLYPDRDLPGFLDKNCVAAERVESSPLLTQLATLSGNRVLLKDVSGSYRFNGDFRNSADVLAALGDFRDEHPDVYCEALELETLAVFEETFSHRSFTGRSGTFFAYEGLGSVYWHMVSKLVLAIQENCESFVDSEAFDTFSEQYFDTLEGLGFNRSPSDYGAFPIDAYSHTPKHAGAQQPGMTGQVKEDILSRWAEFGVKVEGGLLSFEPRLLRASSFLQAPDYFRYSDLKGDWKKVALAAGSLAFTYCKTLIIYEMGERSGLELIYANGERLVRDSLRLGEEQSNEVFSRSGVIDCIKVTIAKKRLRGL
ncbi:MAG: hypothetical protein AAGB46_12350 [Verrucomicrobiota bacterium]